MDNEIEQDKILTESEVDFLIKSLKSRDFDEINSFYKGRRSAPIGTKRIWGGKEYVKEADGWVPSKNKKQSSKDKDDSIKVNGKDFKVLKQVDLSNSKKTAEFAKEAYQVEGSNGKPTYLFLTHDGDWEIADGLNRKKVEVSGMDKEEDPKKDKPEKDKKEKDPDEDSSNVSEVTKDKEEENNEEDTPREEAEEATEEMKDKEFAYARDSEFSNLGEDLIDSARHKRNEWKGLEAAEEDGSASKQIKRDNLLKEMPIDLISKTDETNFMANMVGYSALKKFPKAPEYPGKKDSGDYYTTTSSVLSGIEGRYITEEYYDKYMKGTNSADKYTKIDGDDLRRNIRRQYYDTFNEFKSLVEESKFENVSIKEMMKSYQSFMVEKVKDLRVGDRSNPLANQLVPFVNNTLYPFGGRKKSSALYEIDQVRTSLEKKHGKELFRPEPQSEFLEISKSYMEGNSISKVLGQSSSGKKGFRPSDVYIKGRSERVGPDIGLGTQSNQERMIKEEFGMRGVQWGNSMTDDERKHHLEQANMAMSDLTEVLGLPREMASFNGRLGLAFGARGKGDALAHYESDLKVINLTRKNGVGSLAHEWGHFFDNVMNEISSGNPEGFMSKMAASSRINENQVNTPEDILPIIEAFKGLNVEVEKFKDRFLKDPEAIKDMSSGAKYWTSHEENFARSFEKYIAYKLEKNERKNTYLTANVDHPLWPTAAEVKAMEPHFDRIFETFSKSEALKKSFSMIIGGSYG